MYVGTLASVLPRSLSIIALCALTVLAACGSDGSLRAPGAATSVTVQRTEPASEAPGATEPATVGETTPDGSAATTVASATTADDRGDVAPPAVGDEPVTIGYSVVEERPHDTTAFTQGLLLDDGELWESTGQYERSQLRVLDPVSGEVLRSVAIDDDLFGEGLALVDDHLVQLTWQAGRAIVWDRATMTRLDEYRYDGEGWGLCHDGTQLVMSDGSDRLTFRDATTFEATGSVAVTVRGAPLGQLNELECIDGAVWANVWQTDDIVRIDPGTGVVTGVLDLAPLRPTDGAGGDVLNGIAHDPATGHLLVTGKFWPTLFVLDLDGA